MNWTWRDTWEVLGLGTILGVALTVAAMIGILIHEYAVLLGVIVGLAVGGTLAVLATRTFFTLLNQVSRERWEERLPVILLPPPQKKLTHSATEKDI